MPLYDRGILYRKKQSACAKRSKKSCGTAKKRCSWASGSKRKFCRKRGVTRKARM